MQSVIPPGNECSKFLEESVGTAVIDRRHCNVTCIATAISTRDLRDQAVERCSEGTVKLFS